MTIKIHVPFGIEDIKLTFGAGKETNSLILTSNFLNYFSAISDLANACLKINTVTPISHRAEKQRCAGIKFVSRVETSIITLERLIRY